MNNTQKALISGATVAIIGGIIALTMNRGDGSQVVPNLSQDLSLRRRTALLGHKVNVKSRFKTWGEPATYRLDEFEGVLEKNQGDPDVVCTWDSVGHLTGAVNVKDVVSIEETK